MSRSIVHFDMDTFFVSVEIKNDSSLKGKPVLIGGSSDRAVVSSCSYEARSFGVSSGMPMKQALRLCPQALIRRGDMELYSKESEQITQIILDQAPLSEKASIDEHYLDVSGMDKWIGTVQWIKALRMKIIKESGLPISCGFSINKSVAKVATGVAKPNNEKWVQLGAEKVFLAPLPVRKIPGVGPEMSKDLAIRGVRQIAQLQALTPDFMLATFNKPGVAAWEKANAIDDAPVIPYREQKSISKEETFQVDTTDVDFLRRKLMVMISHLAFDLREQQKLTACITVKIKYSDMNTHTRDASIPYTSLDDVLIQKAVELFNKLYDRRMLVRLIGVKLSKFVSGSYQIDLFADTGTNLNLYHTLDSIRKRYGFDAVMKASIL